MSNSADSAKSSARGRLRPVRLLTIGVFALAGLIFFTSFNTAKGTNIRTDGSLLKLSDLIQERSRKNKDLEAVNSGARSDVERLAERDNGSTKADNEKVDALEKASGTKKLKGEAISVTLDDAPPNAAPKLPGYPDPQPNDLVIHQQDLQAVVNALWHGGAKGIKVMDQRLISTSAVRCVGNTLILQGRVYSPPYVVTAIGDTDRMQAALESDAEVANLREWSVAVGLGYDVGVLGDQRFPAYVGSILPEHAEVPES